MALPKIKKTLPLTYPPIGYARREELLEDINKDGTYLPKSILHEDLDRGFLDFIKNDLKTEIRKYGCRWGEQVAWDKRPCLFLFFWFLDEHAKPKCFFILVCLDRSHQYERRRRAQSCSI